MKTFYLKVGYKTNWEDDFSACIGYFDGLHLGHLDLINLALKKAEAANIKAAMITFDPDPWETIHQKKYHHLMTIEDRIKKAESLGFDYFIILTFNQEMAHLKPDLFISDILNEMPLKHLICGFDFTYGFQGKGTTKTLIASNRDFEVSVVPEVAFQDEKISTTRIINLIRLGKVSEANRLLNHLYEIKGVVVTGRSQGKKIGFPTANIAYYQEYVMPKQGVYIGKIKVSDNLHWAMISIGHNPTFNYREDLTLEVNILDFTTDIYGETVVVYFYEFLRDQIKFNNIFELIEQLEADETATREYIKENYKAEI